MKRFIIATALTLAAASSVMAGTYGTTLPATLEHDIRTYVPNADLSNLTVSQVSQFYALFAKSENLRSGENPAGTIQVILSNNG
jgi:hypothetical protein